MAKGFILSGYLPGEEHQGLTALYDGMVAAHAKRKRPDDIVVVALLRRHTVKTFDDTDNEPQVTARIVAAEPLTGSMAEVARDLLTTAKDARVGQTMFGADGAATPDAAPDAAPAGRKRPGRQQPLAAVPTPGE